MAPNVIDEDAIAQVYTNVRRIHRDGHLRLAVAVGAQVVKKLLGDDIGRWLEHGQAEPAVKELAKRLAADPLEVMSPTKLYRCIGVYELNERVKVLDRPHLTLTHAVAVLGLPGNVQADLLREAEADKWSTRHLLDEAQMLRAADREPSDRDPPSRLSRATQRLLKLLSDPAFDDLGVEPEDGEDGEGVAARIAEAIQRLQKLHVALTGREVPTASPASTPPTPVASPSPVEPTSPPEPTAAPPQPHTVPQQPSPAPAEPPAAGSPSVPSPTEPLPIDPTLTGLAKATAAALAYGAAMSRRAAALRDEGGG
jgi:hypothetical protein